MGKHIGQQHEAHNDAKAYQFCCPAYLLPMDLITTSTPVAEKEKVVDEIQIMSGPSGFKTGELRTKCSISFMEEAAVVAFFILLFFAPLVLAILLLCAVSMGTWCQFSCLTLMTAFLSLHPLPTGPRGWLVRSRAMQWLTSALFKYFTIRFIWTGDARKKCFESPAFLTLNPPHGVLPFGGLCGIPTINHCSRHNAFVGTAASIVFRTPFLRYVSLWGTIQVSKSSIMAALDRGDSVGIVPDGIMGIFHTNEYDEVVACAERRGIARLALRMGRPVVPSYALGNTDCMHAFFDPWGLMKALSKRLHLALFLPVGRWGMPVPRRVNISILFGDPIDVQQNATPTEAEVDALHRRILADVKHLFESHKAAVGWESKKLRFI